MTEDAQNTEPSFRDSALQYLDGLYGYAMTLTRNQSEAEDLVQEAYVRAMGAYERLRPDTNLKSWLFSILRNIRLSQIHDALSKSRSVDTYRPSSMPVFEDNSWKDPLFSYLAKVRQADVRKAIEELPAVYRDVIVLCEFEALSYREIAQILDCPCGTVMSRLKRARERLKELLRQWSFGTSETVSEAGQ